MMQVIDGPLVKGCGDCVWIDGHPFCTMNCSGREKISGDALVSWKAKVAIEKAASALHEFEGRHSSLSVQFCLLAPLLQAQYVARVKAWWGWNDPI